MSKDWVIILFDPRAGVSVFFKMVLKEVSKLDELNALITNVKNIQHEYKSYFNEEWSDLKSELDRLIGFKNNDLIGFIVKNEEYKIKKYANTFCQDVLDDLTNIISINMKKGIIFSSEKQEIRKMERKLASSTKNVVDIMELYREKIQEKLTETINDKLDVKFYQNIQFWSGVILGVVLSFVINYLIKKGFC